VRLRALVDPVRQGGTQRPVQLDASQLGDLGESFEQCGTPAVVLESGVFVCALLDDHEHRRVLGAEPAVLDGSGFGSRCWRKLGCDLTELVET
jgi:hypothetical protein